ncbi:uncharacterized protein LOC117177373 [Belonocnema kinseyi]|uniref:uncharacterized protein LOC117177373 n=1 Tax=Belonocnema kinseyi TaxID=2817044 RepID=UPI00143D9917|nr:uncharacterized protein LOC117177373 [Belonocnema kinseyi]
MFSDKSCVNATLISGTKETCSFFIFEAAIHWAEEGHRVIYIAPKALQSPPLTHHDRSNPSTEAFKLMRFMYLPNYETLVEQLVDLHSFASLPNVLLVDDLDNYIEDPGVKDKREVHIARLCAILLDTMNACAVILKQNVHICVSISSECEKIYQLYFDKLWKIEEEDDGNIVKVKQVAACNAANKTYEYRKYGSENIILKQILYSQN